MNGSKQGAGGTQTQILKNRMKKKKEGDKRREGGRDREGREEEAEREGRA